MKRTGKRAPCRTAGSLVLRNGRRRCGTHTSTSLPERASGGAYRRYDVGELFLMSEPDRPYTARCQTVTAIAYRWGCTKTSFPRTWPRSLMR